jgi:hypothetical protein
MDAHTSDTKAEAEAGEESPRTSVSSNTSNFIVQSPGAVTPTRRNDSIDDIGEGGSRLTMTRRLSTLSTLSSLGDLGEGGLNWSPREAGMNGLSNSLCGLT